MKFYEIIIVLICSIILIFFAWCHISYPKLRDDISKDNITWKTKDELFQELKDGDLIFLCGVNYTENILKWLGNCSFSHIGIIVKEDDELYVWDCDIGQGYKEGVRVMKLKDKLERFKGEKVICVKKLYGPELNKDKLFKIVKDSLNITFYKGIWKWALADILPIRRNEKSMFCSEFVAYVLQELSIIKKNKVPYAYTPGDFFSNNIPYEGKYFYGENIFCHI